MGDSPFGVSLAVYAGVVTALAEGHALERILVQEGLAVDAWRAAEPEWKARLAASAVRGDAEFSAFRARAIEAEDVLFRRVTPLADDLSAWLAFVHGWSTAAEPRRFLEERGLGANDIARLRRSWDERFERDRDLAVLAARKLAEGDLGAPPFPRVEPALLRRFPWSQAKDAAPSTPEPTERDLDERHLARHEAARRDAARANPHALGSSPREPSTTPAPRPWVAPPAPSAPSNLLDATAPMMTALVLDPLPFVAASHTSEPPRPHEPSAPHPNVGETLELGAFTDAMLRGNAASMPPASAPLSPTEPSIQETAELDARLLGDLDAAAPFALPKPPSRRP